MERLTVHFHSLRYKYSNEHFVLENLPSVFFPQNDKWSCTEGRTENRRNSWLQLSGNSIYIIHSKRPLALPAPLCVGAPDTPSTWQGFSCGQHQSICQRVPYPTRTLVNVWHFQFWTVYMRAEAAHPSPDTIIDRRYGGRRLGFWWWPGLVHFVQEEGSASHSEHGAWHCIIIIIIFQDLTQYGQY